MAAFDSLWHHWLGRPYKLALTIDEGAGAPVVLLHGIASSGTTWREVAALLDHKKFRVIAIDLLGFGTSPKPGWSDYSVEEHAAAVAFTLKRLKVKHAVLVGHSMGGLVAVHVAATTPELVRQLVLYEPPLLVDSPEFRGHNRRREMYLSFFGFMAARPQMMLTYGKVLGRIASKVSGFALNEETWVPFERSLRNTIMQQESYDELRAIQVPTDIIHGRFDALVVRSDIEAMFAGNAHIRFHVANEIHAVSARAGRYIAELIAMGKPQNRTQQKSAGAIKPHEL